MEFFYIFRRKNGKNLKFVVLSDIMYTRQVIEMVRNYLNINVYEAFQNRMEYIFQEFENIYVSFSGGKDSGLLLNLVLDYMKSHNIKKSSVYFIRILKHSMQLQQVMFRKHLKKILILLNLIGSVCLWRQELRLAAMKCTGIHGTIPKKIFGLDLCLTNRM